MAMLPWARQFMDDFWEMPRPLLRPAVLFDQDFGSGLHADDLMPPTMYHHHYYRPRRQASRLTPGSSEVNNEPSEFKIMLDVNQFSPEEINVKTVDNYIVIDGKHEEKMDDHGFVSRQFTRRYVLPKEAKPEDVKTALSRDGILTISAPKAAIEGKPNERAVPITMSDHNALPSTKQKKEVEKMEDQ